MAESNLAEEYIQLSSPQELCGLYLMDKAPLTPGKVVLDLGCGPGNLTARLAEKVAPQGRVVGVDPDAERIKLAKEMYHDVSNLSFVVGSDAELPGCKPETYDVIYSNMVFHWIKDKRTAFQRIYECLKPGGTAILSFSVKLPDPLKALTEAMDGERAAGLLYKWSFEPCSVYKNACTEAGFTIVTLEEKFGPRYFKTVEDLCKWWTATTHGEFDAGLVTPERMKKISFTTADNGQILVQQFHAYLVLTKVTGRKSL